MQDLIFFSTPVFNIYVLNLIIIFIITLSLTHSAVWDLSIFSKMYDSIFITSH